MAPSRRNRVSVVVFDAKKQAYLIFTLKMKHIFSDRPDESDHEVQRFFPPPLALFERADYCENMDFALHGATSNIIAVTSRARTIVYDADSNLLSPGPDLCAIKLRPILLPVGDSSFVAMSLYPHGAGPHFESIDLSQGSSACWRVLPELPGPRSYLMDHNSSEVTAYFVAGTRVWVSLHGMGTFSFDMTTRQWRKEGTWMLPVIGRAVLAPAGGGGGPSLLFGFCDSAAHLCACDIEASPPVVRVTWEDNAYPKEWCDRIRCGMASRIGDLTYFGGGRFCTAIVMMGEYNNPLQFLCITALQVTANLELIKRRFRCYLMEPEEETAYFL